MKTKMTKTNFKEIMAIAATVLVFGCKAEDRSAPKNPVVPVPLQKFDLGSVTQGDANNQTFQNNKAFFWKEPDANVVERVLHAAKNIDLNDDRGVAARIQMTAINASVGKAAEELTAAAAALDDATKDALSNLRDLVDEKVTSFTNEEFSEKITKTEGELMVVNVRLISAAGKVSEEVQNTLIQIGQLGMERARLGQTDPARDTMQQKIDDLTKTLPADLPATVVAPKAAREALLVTYEGHFRDKARRAELVQLIDDATKTLPALPAEVKVKKDALDAAFIAKETQFHVQVQIEKRGEELVDSVISSTSYFESMPERVSLNFTGGRVDVTIVGFPEKTRTLSTEEGTITNVTYKEMGGVLRFEARPVVGGDYFRFRISRTRTEIKDGRLFYQGDMDLCQFDTKCDAKDGTLLRHGIAKLATSN